MVDKYGNWYGHSAEDWVNSMNVDDLFIGRANANADLHWFIEIHVAYNPVENRSIIQRI